MYLFRVAARSAAETRVHVRVAHAWGWVESTDIEPQIDLAQPRPLLAPDPAIATIASDPLAAR